MAHRQSIGLVLTKPGSVVPTVSPPSFLRVSVVPTVSPPVSTLQRNFLLREVKIKRGLWVARGIYILAGMGFSR